MPSVPIETSRQDAFDHIIEAMQSQYPAMLASLADANLPLPAPDDDDYFYVPQDVDEVIKNRNVAVFVYPAGPRTTADRSTGGTATGEIVRKRFPVDITVLCRRSMVDGNVAGQGKNLTGDEILQRRVERYLGAMLAVVLKYCRCGRGGLVDAELQDDMPSLFFDEESEKPLWGVATAQFTFVQKVKLPLGSSLP